MLRQPPDVPFTMAAGGPVAVLGALGYDTIPSRAAERVVRGTAHPGEFNRLVPPCVARPLVHCSGGLACPPEAVDEQRVRFAGTGAGACEIVGQQTR